MTRRGICLLALAIVGVFGIALGAVTVVAYRLGQGHTKVQRFYYPVEAPSPIAAGTSVPPGRWVWM